MFAPLGWEEDFKHGIVLADLSAVLSMFVVSEFSVILSEFSMRLLDLVQDWCVVCSLLCLCLILHSEVMLHFMVVCIGWKLWCVLLVWILTNYNLLVTNKLKLIMFIIECSLNHEQSNISLSQLDFENLKASENNW